MEAPACQGPETGKDFSDNHKIDKDKLTNGAYVCDTLGRVCFHLQHHNVLVKHLHSALDVVIIINLKHTNFNS